MVASWYLDVNVLHSKLFHLRDPFAHRDDQAILVALESDDRDVFEFFELAGRDVWSGGGYTNGCPDVGILRR